MAIVGINLGKTVLSRTGKVEGVGGAEEDGRGQAGVGGFHTAERGIRERQSMEAGGGAVILKLLQQFAKPEDINVPFAKDPVKGRHGLGATMHRGSHVIGGCQGAHGLPSGVFDVEADEVAGVEVDHSVAVAVLGNEVGDVAVTGPWPERPALHHFLESGPKFTPGEIGNFRRGRGRGGLEFCDGLAVVGDEDAFRSSFADIAVCVLVEFADADLDGGAHG